MPKTPEYIQFDRYTGFALDSATGMRSGPSIVDAATILSRNPSGTYVITGGHYGYINDPNNDGNLEDPPIFPESSTDSVGNPILVPDPGPGGGGGGGGGGDGGGDNAVLEDTVGSAILYPEGGGIKSDGPMCALDSVRSCLFQGSFDDSCSMNKIMLHGLNGGILLDEYSNAPATSIMWPAVRGAGVCGEPTDRIMDIGDSVAKFNQINGHIVKAYGAALEEGFISDHFQHNPDGAAASNLVIVGKSCGLKFHATNNSLIPTGANTRGNQDNLVFLGTSAARFKLVYSYDYYVGMMNLTNFVSSHTSLASALNELSARLTAGGL